MQFNLNRQSHPDQQLKENQINEMIGIYGVECDFLYTEKMNVDKVLMDFSHLKLSEKDSIKIFVMPENPEGYGEDLNWSMFGLENKRKVHFFISKKSCQDIIANKQENFDYSDKLLLKDISLTMINSILVMPNGTLLEITDVLTEVEGINNLFTFSDDQSVYRLSTQVYYNNIQDEMSYDTNKDSVPIKEQTSDIAPLIDYPDNPPSDNYEDSFEDIDNYFNSLDDVKIEQDDEGDQISSSDSVFGSLG